MKFYMGRPAARDVHSRSVPGLDFRQYRSSRCARAMRCCGTGLFVLLISLLMPDSAVGQRVEQATPSSAGGVSRGGSFTLRSALGVAVPAGSTQNGSVVLRSGWTAILPAHGGVPTVLHSPPEVHPAGQALEIEVAVDRKSLIDSARLLYRRGGESAFSSAEMTESEDGYAGLIPADALTSRGIAYYVDLVEWSGRTIRFPEAGIFSARVAVAEPGVTMDTPIPGGTKPSGYRIFSVPLDLDDNDPGSVLVDDLGPYDVSRWRLFRLRSDEILSEYPGTGAMIPGRGFWLINSESGRRISTGAGTSVDLSRPYSVVLHPGWNLVGTPFHFQIPVDHVHMQSGQPILLRSFIGSWNDPIQAPVRTMEPFSGYAVFNNLHILDELIIDPDVTASKSGQSSSPLLTGSLSWAVRITAEGGGARDGGNLAGVAEGARAGMDPGDLPEPPVIGSFVSVYFPHPEWGAPTSRFATDVRPETPDGHVWDVEVRGNVDGPVQLRFDGVEQVPPEFHVRLVDESLQHALDLRASNEYALASVTPDEPRRLRLVIGGSEFVANNLETMPPSGDDYELLPSFPNPFHVGTTIRYVLPAPAAVTVKVYDVVGRTVAILAQDVVEDAGHHVRIWDGRGIDGRAVPSGLYFLRLEADGRVVTRPAIKVR